MVKSTTKVNMNAYAQDLSKFLLISPERINTYTLHAPKKSYLYALTYRDETKNNCEPVSNLIADHNSSCSSEVVELRVEFVFLCVSH